MLNSDFPWKPNQPFWQNPDVVSIWKPSSAQLDWWKKEQFFPLLGKKLDWEFCLSKSWSQGPAGFLIGIEGGVNYSRKPVLVHYTTSYRCKPYSGWIYFNSCSLFLTPGGKKWDFIVEYLDFECVFVQHTHRCTFNYSHTSVTVLFKHPEAHSFPAMFWEDLKAGHLLNTPTAMFN